ncbi:MAG: tRNA 4-thiouridine(8) synthase ThiI [Clostridiales bacterium]|nr:tRNA 4-thiouridine(8) synthase ThiI [Clostridiales bacterium]
MTSKLLLVKYAEIHLKGQNRPYFQRLLLRNLRLAVKHLNANAILYDSRIFVTNYEDETACIDAITKVFGVHSVCPTVQIEKSNFDHICELAADIMKDVSGTFKVIARRADKRYFLDSPQICAKVGAHVLRNNPELRVDVHNPEHVLNVEIRDQALLYAKTYPAVGGLPTGTAGRAMLLLSGGIDSPVSGFRIAKRGVQLSAVYYHSFPYTGEPVKEKIISLAKILTAYCGAIRLFVVPFTEIQQAIHEKCPEDFTTLIMRRNMMRIADQLAEKNKALALITGESIGQVASQTLEALACTDEVVSRPVFRPLIGMDKLEIINEAKQINTYETSCLPYEDCCTVFTPRHPVTHPKLKQAQFAEQPLREDDLLEQMIARAIAGTEVIDFKPQ